MSESDKKILWTSPSLILLWSLSLWLLVGNTGLTPVVRSYRQYSKHNCKLLCEQGISRLTPVKKMRLSIPKTHSVNVAIIYKESSLEVNILEVLFI